MAKKDREACYFKLSPELKAAARKRASDLDLSLARYLRGLIRADVQASA